MTVHNRPWLAFIKTLLGLLLCLVLIFACLIGYVWYYAQERAVTPVPAAIVLGAAAWGNKPSPVFKERIRHALYLY